MSFLVYLTLLAIAYQTCLGQEDCATTGVHCDTNCSNVIVCPILNGIPTIIRTCEEGTFCGTNGTWYDCSHDHCSNPNAAHKFLCLQLGTFPSPYQCGKFYICTTANAAPITECTCETGEFFDIATQSCTTGDCPREPVDCQYPGESGKFENYCYACSPTFDAYLYRCSNSTYADMSITPRVETCGPYTGL